MSINMMVMRPNGFLIADESIIGGRLMIKEGNLWVWFNFNSFKTTSEDLNWGIGSSL